MARHILITGGTGFIGRELCHLLLQRGDNITLLSRQPAPAVNRICGNVIIINNLQAIPEQPPIDAVINLAGEGIAARRWTHRRKKQLWDSRVSLTKELVTNLTRCQQFPGRIISGSATGYYGDQGSDPVSESTQPNQEYTHELCQAWEDAAADARSSGCMVACVRLGPVAGAGGGFLSQMLPAFRLGLGGRLGDGQQYFPWIHRKDVVSVILWLLDQSDIDGAWNLTSPTPVTNAEFTQILGQVLHRPTWLPVPAPLLRLGLGEMARLLLTGQRAHPRRLQAAGYEFQFPTLKPALEDILRKPR